MAKKKEINSKMKDSSGVDIANDFEYGKMVIFVTVGAKISMEPGSTMNLKRPRHKTIKQQDI